MKIIQHYNRRNIKKAAPVEWEVYFNRADRVYISTKVIIEKKDWDAQSREVKPGHPDSMMYNMKIRAVRDSITEVALLYQSRELTLTGNLLRIELANNRPVVTVNDYMQHQIEADRHSLEESTYKRLKSVLKAFNEFQTVTFNQCDTAFLRLYHIHLLKSMQSTTTGKNHKVLSKYLRRAANDGLIKVNPYVNFKIPAYTTRKTYLSTEELDLIRTKEITLERLSVVRDLFIFMCNTGMEYVDLMDLTDQNIADIDGRNYIVKSRMKLVGEIQAIPIFPEAQAIINRYSTGHGKIFPDRSNQRLNSYLKELATICNIDKTLTTIVARHTFATLMLTRGMPMESVSQMMGHSNIKTTKGYAKLIVLKIENDLTRLGIDKI